MQIKRPLLLLLCWLVLSALLALLLSVGSHYAVRDDIDKSLRRHLSQSLNKAYFSSAENRVNDRRALHYVGQQINAALEGLVSTRWYAAQGECVVRLQRIDDVVIDEAVYPSGFALDISRNQIQREVIVGWSCTPQWWFALCLAGCLGLLFLLIGRALPLPLARDHRRWINYLLERGYSGSQAFDVVCTYTSDQLKLSPHQLECLEHLHDGERGNFARALEVVSSPGFADLDAVAVAWFLLGLNADMDNTGAALELARAPDSVLIDLPAMRLLVRGRNVPMSGTPFFYYAWYAMNRRQGEGWVANPASNRPDMVAGHELAQMMTHYQGHGRAINDLEQHGLKARTLDQNRSKIKDELAAELGERLAANYLFEARKHPDGVQMSYRLSVDAARIQVIE